MLKTRSAICEYREHMNLYRVPRPSSCQNRLFVGFTVRFSHVSSCLLAPHPVYSFSVCFSPFSPSHYSVKTKSPLLLFFSIAFSTGSLPLIRQNQILPFTLFQYGIAFSIRSHSLLH